MEKGVVKTTSLNWDSFSLCCETTKLFSKFVVPETPVSIKLKMLPILSTCWTVHTKLFQLEVEFLEILGKFKLLDVLNYSL